MNLNFFRRRRGQPQPETPFSDAASLKTSAAPAGATAVPPCIISGDNNITLILDDGKTHSIGTSHPNHSTILKEIRQRNWAALPALVDVPKAMMAYSQGKVAVNEFGEVSYAGEPVHSVIAERITQFFQQGLPFEPLVRFLENLMANPSRRAIEELYSFLENEGMPITEDGCFVGYKAVRPDYLDVHSRSFDNKPGAVHEMPRNLVDDDARQACSNGFHIGSQKYASTFGGAHSRMMLVKVNPADAVSVPYEDAGKLRACRYEVLREVDKSTIIKEPMYSDVTYEDIEEDGYSPWGEDETCHYCGEFGHDEWGCDELKPF